MDLSPIDIMLILIGLIVLEIAIMLYLEAKSAGTQKAIVIEHRTRNNLLSQQLNLNQDKFAHQKAQIPRVRA